MAGYNTINAHDADCRYPFFLGLNQYGDGTSNSDQRYAVEEKNVETINGVMQPCAANKLLAPILEQPIETLALLHRRWHTIEGEDKDILIAASAGYLWWAHPGDSTWTRCEAESGTTEAFNSSVWSCVTYEINLPGSTAPVDVLLMSNAEDGMIMVRGDTQTYKAVPTPKKFGVIERYAERIWGGAIKDDPDMLVYSAPYDPEDWNQRTPEYDPENPLPWTIAGEPEDGAGDVQQPSWDGDSFTALKSFGSQLIAFKRTRVWRVLGTDPGEYTFKEQFGGGFPYAATIAVDTSRILALTNTGPVYYDGSSVTDFRKTEVEGIFRRVNTEAMDKACACLWQGKYYCAIPVDGSEYNNAVLIYNTLEGSWLFRDDLTVEAFLPGENRMFYTSSTAPGRVYEWQENSWKTGTVTDAPTRWVTAWNDLNYMQIIKGPFDLYALPEALDGPVVLKFSIETERRLLTKKMLCLPLESQYVKQRTKKLHFPGFGRRFRLIIEADGGQGRWRLLDGVMVVPEIERD